MNVIFKIGNSKKHRFTTIQLSKVEKAIAILNAVIECETFKISILSFNWKDKNQDIYNRFHMSKSMSNVQVWNCLSNGSCTWGNKKIQRANKTIEVIPCMTKTDYRNESWSVTGNICVNSLIISNKSYTPVHLASAIFHEYCVICCDFAAITNGALSEHNNWTVPFGCGTLIKECVSSLFPDDLEIQNWVAQCNTVTFNYLPPSMIWIDVVKQEMIFTTSGCVKVDQMIYAMDLELDCLENGPENTDKATERMMAIKYCSNSLKRMRDELFTTSLDGTKAIVMPTEMPKHMSMI